ncbi:MAG: DUF1285 domain-containing protein [Candidatus Competibacteraceae bacterium]
MNPTTGCDYALMPASPPAPASLVAPFTSTDRMLPPVERWNPPFSDNMPIHIACDGTWRHNSE